jgi:hypothetical protein
MWSEDVNGTARQIDGEQLGEPDRADLEEVDRQDARCLRAQELPPALATARSRPEAG